MEHPITGRTHRSSLMVQWRIQACLEGRGGEITILYVSRGFGGYGISPKEFGGLGAHPRTIFKIFVQIGQ